MAQPESTIVSFCCKSFSCYKLSDSLEKKGLYVEKQSNPESIHMTMMPAHIGKVKDIIAAMKTSIAQIKGDLSLFDNGSKAVYGMMAKIPDEAIVEDFIVHYLSLIHI